MGAVRQCSKPACSKTAVATLTYNYRDSTAVLGPLSASADPHAFDLCESHADSLTVPRGWEVVRLQTEFEPAPPSADDLLALVEAIREVAGKPEAPEPSGFTSTSRMPGRARGPEEDPASKYAPLRRREHFTVVTGDAEPDSPPRRVPEEGSFGRDT